MQIDLIVKELETLSVAISQTATNLKKYEVGNVVENKPNTKSPTLEEVRAILAEKSQDGFTAEVRALLEKYGAKRLSEIDPANYKALLQDAEALSND